VYLNLSTEPNQPINHIKKMGWGSRGRSSGGGGGGGGGGRRTSMKSVSSSRSTGVYTSSGTKVRNVQAYAATGAPTFNGGGRQLYSPTSYSNTVQSNSMHRAAERVVRANPNARGFSYVTNLECGKKYVGMTTKPEQRVYQHLSGNGSAVTRELKPQSITIKPHYSKAEAKAAETSTYFKAKNAHGANNVRGAGNTARFSLSG
jgi:predicted GIY-YIG superfamily endonuclease